MARTIQSDLFQPEVLTDTLRAKMEGENVFMGRMAATGAAIVNPTLSRGPESVGSTIKVPYFGTIGEFETGLTDGDALTPRKIESSNEEATVGRSGISFEATAWAQLAGSDDLYDAAANLMIEALGREMDRQAVNAAVASGVMTVGDGTATLSWDDFVQARVKYGDQIGRIAAVAVHSQSYADMLRLKDSNGRPYMVDDMQNGDFGRFCGIPVVVSDRVPVTGSTMGSVTSAGTTPPTVTLAGTPSGPWDLVIECVTGGLSDGTATFRFSTDGGDTWSNTHTIPSGGGAIALDESRTATAVTPAVDSLVGINGATGVTATFANGTYNADNSWSAEAAFQSKALLLQPQSILLYYNRSLLEMLTDTDILRHTDIAAMHLYMVAHRYRRRPGSTRGGVVAYHHKLTQYDGVL